MFYLNYFFYFTGSSHFALWTFLLLWQIQPFFTLITVILFNTNIFNCSIEDTNFCIWKYKLNNTNLFNTNDTCFYNFYNHLSLLYVFINSVHQAGHSPHAILTLLVRIWRPTFLYELFSATDSINSSHSHTKTLSPPKILLGNTVQN